MTDDANQALQRPNSTQIARSAALLIGVLAFAKLFSLSEKWIGLDRFGIGSEWDTFAVANQLPEQLYTLIAGGALAFAFIPIFADLLQQGKRREAWRLASNVVNSVFLVALLVSAVAFIFAPWLVEHVLAPGFAQPFISFDHPLRPSFIQAIFRPDLIAQTAGLMRILLLSLSIFAVSGLISGVLQTHQHFFLPALAPIMFDVGNLLGVLVLARYFGVYGAAIGAVIGAVLHLLIQVPGLWRYRAQWWPVINWRDPRLREVVRLMIPRSISLALANFSLLMAYNFASKFSAGSAAAFNRGWTLMQLPETLIGTAMGIVIFPTLALLSASGDLKGKRSALSGALRFILIASIPAAVLMVLAGRPLVAILEGGSFDSTGASRVFQVLQFWALGIVTHSCLEVVARSFFADKDMMTPLYAGIVQITLYFLFANWLAPSFEVAGLALANSLAVGVELLFLMIILRRRWQGIDERMLLITLAKTLLATIIMGLVVGWLEPYILRLELGLPRRLLLLLQAGALLGIGGMVYLLTMILLRVKEILQLPQLILRRRAVQPATGD